jgi:hypothetical protein
MFAACPYRALAQPAQMDVDLRSCGCELASRPTSIGGPLDATYATADSGGAGSPAARSRPATGMMVGSLCLRPPSTHACSSSHSDHHLLSATSMVCSRPSSLGLGPKGKLMGCPQPLACALRRPVASIMAASSMRPHPESSSTSARASSASPPRACGCSPFHAVGERDGR